MKSTYKLLGVKWDHYPLPKNLPTFVENKEVEHYLIDRNLFDLERYERRVNLTEILSKDDNLPYDVAENVRECDFFTSLSHIDYVVRYVPKELINCPLPEYFGRVYEKNARVIDEILKIIIKRGQALEVNTKGAFTDIGHVHPSDEIMKRYRELGGTKLTYGSDAHFSEKVGDGIYGI